MATASPHCSQPCSQERKPAQRHAWSALWSGMVDISAVHVRIAFDSPWAKPCGNAPEHG